jgi:hypothetical protein
MAIGVGLIALYRWTADAYGDFIGLGVVGGILVLRPLPSYRRSSSKPDHWARAGANHHHPSQGLDPRGWGPSALLPSNNSALRFPPSELSGLAEAWLRAVAADQRPLREVPGAHAEPKGGTRLATPSGDGVAPLFPCASSMYKLMLR